MERKMVNCDLCSAEMKLEKVLPTKKKYKVKRYICPICGFEKSEFGSGYNDNMVEVIESQKAVNRMYHQQERNNE